MLVGRSIKDVKPIKFYSILLIPYINNNPHTKKQIITQKPRPSLTKQPSLFYYIYYI